MQTDTAPPVEQKPLDDNLTLLARVLPHMHIEDHVQPFIPFSFVGFGGEYMQGARFGVDPEYLQHVQAAVLSDGEAALRGMQEREERTFTPTSETPYNPLVAAALSFAHHPVIRAYDVGVRTGVDGVYTGELIEHEGSWAHRETREMYVTMAILSGAVFGHMDMDTLRTTSGVLERHLDTPMYDHMVMGLFSEGFAKGTVLETDVTAHPRYGIFHGALTDALKRKTFKLHPLDWANTV